MFECTLIKVERPDTAGGLRTESADGNSERVPTVGEYFKMLGEPLDKNAIVRYIETSEVKTVEKEDKDYIFTTESGSTYKLRVWE